MLGELAEDPDLCAVIFEASGLDVRSALEIALERLERDQREMQDKLDSIGDLLTEQDNAAGR